MREVLDAPEHNFFWDFVASWMNFRKVPSADQKRFISDQRALAEKYGIRLSFPTSGQKASADGSKAIAAKANAPKAEATAQAAKGRKDTKTTGEAGQAKTQERRPIPAAAAEVCYFCF